MCDFVVALLCFKHFLYSVAWLEVRISSAS